MKFNHTSRTHERDWAEAAEKTITALGRSRDISADVREKIREYYRGASPDGMYRSEAETYSGMMVWSVAVGDGV